MVEQSLRKGEVRGSSPLIGSLPRQKLAGTQMAVYTYMLKSFKTGSYYIGISSNPRARLKEHNRGKSKYTAPLKPFTLVFAREHDNYQEARKHEKWLKKKNISYKNRLTSLGIIPPSQAG